MGYCVCFIGSPDQFFQVVDSEELFREEKGVLVVFLDVLLFGVKNWEFSLSLDPCAFPALQASSFHDDFLPETRVLPFFNFANICFFQDIHGLILISDKIPVSSEISWFFASPHASESADLALKN